MLPERIPPRLRDRFAIAIAGVQVGAARRAEALAVRPAQRIAGGLEQPVLAHGRPEVELTRVRVDRVDIWVVRIAFFGEDQMHFVVDVGGRIGQAASTVESHFAIHAAVPIEASRAGRGQTTCYADRASRARVIRSPDRIVRTDLGVHGDRSIA